MRLKRAYALATDTDGCRLSVDVVPGAIGSRQLVDFGGRSLCTAVGGGRTGTQDTWGWMLAYRG